MELVSLLGVCTSDSPPSATCCLIWMIHPDCNNSAAVALFFGSLSKHFLKKLMPSGESCSLVGSWGGFPWAMLYMIAHSLSRLAHGRRPVTISRITHPSDQTSIAPWRPSFWPLMTSGDMYIGVPVMDFCLPGERAPGPVLAGSAARVLP